MWAELGDEVRLELSQLRGLVREYGGLLRSARTRPDPREAAVAVAGVLHSFYTGVENIFQRVAKRIDGDLPGGTAWHRELLDAMARPAAARPPVISQALRDRLEEYLRFRHFFRHAYSFIIDIDDVAALGQRCPACLAQLEEELSQFLAAASSGEPPGGDQTGA